MKLHIGIKLVFGISLLLLTRQVTGQIEPKDRLFKTRVPFAFFVGDMHFPAGTYILSHLGAGIILIEKDDASARGMLLVQTESLPAEKNVYPGLLVFNVYGEHRFLSQIWTGYDSQLHRTLQYAAERRLRASLRATTVYLRAKW